MASLDGSLSVARARRRPARYSPELSAAAAIQQQQHHQSATEMCISELLANGTPESVAAATLAQRLQEQLQQEQEENAEEANDHEEMAPAKRGKSKAKKRCSKKRSNVNEDGSKRPRVANVLLENEMLIDEIRARKALWMRTHEQHHSSVLTAPLWEEIAKALDTTREYNIFFITFLYLIFFFYFYGFLMLRYRRCCRTRAHLYIRRSFRFGEEFLRLGLGTLVRF